MCTLYDKLKRYRDSDYYGFHMPGHKRNLDMMDGVSPYQIDITEIEGFDDLHHPEGILKKAQERAAEVYHAEETHFLINGSTVGILSAILGVTRKGDRILVARNCHKSVYHAIYMNELIPVYLYPDFDEGTQLNTEISVQDVREALDEYPQIRAVVIVSPTYDGVVSDVAAIASAVHEKGLPLVVDEAHGAHFGFHPYFPENSNIKGADIVIHSLHKTLPSLTQTALLHINGGIVDRERIRNYLHMLQSSSPSYVLMAGIDACIQMLERDRERLFDSYVRQLKDTRRQLAQLKRLRLLEAEHYDYSKVIIAAGNTGLTGRELYEALLERYHLQMEMMAGTYVLAMTSVGDTREGLNRLMQAVSALDGAPGFSGSFAAGFTCVGEFPRLPRIYTSAEIQSLYEIEKEKTEKEKQQKKELQRKEQQREELQRKEQQKEKQQREELQRKEQQKKELQGKEQQKKEVQRQKPQGGRIKRVLWEESEGFISLEYAYLYPPGSPMAVPGERITKKLIRQLLSYREAGFKIEGLKTEGQIEVWTDGADILYHG